MKKNILVVDDSALMRRAICDIINSGNEFEATDTCRDGLEAYEKIKNNSYDAVLLDINMPRMNGLELLQKLQKENIRATVVVVSSLAKEDASITIQAMEYGAIDFITKPENIIEAKGIQFRTDLSKLLNSILPQSKQAKASLVQPVLIKPMGGKTGTPAGAKQPGAAATKPTSAAARAALSAAAARASTAATAANAAAGMAERLNELSKVQVKEAQENDILKKGCVYVAPGGYHLEVVAAKDGTHKIHLSDAPAIGGLRPCANVMYKSLRRSSYDEIVCVVLTGMGADGTDGIRDLNRAKPIYVIAQDEPTCVVYGMPKAIAEAGLVDEVVPLTNIPKRIINQVGVK